MLFKGTERRSSRELAESIEGRGGSLNAFTDKEGTCYYCRVLSDDVANGIDVLTDMMLHSVFDPVELAREENVVLEEIKRSEDEPSDHVHELHVSRRWAEHPLGKPVLGTPDSVSGFKRDDLKAYLQRRYVGDNVLLSVAGNVDPETVHAAAEETLGKLSDGGGDEALPKPSSSVDKVYVAKDVEQVHFCIGTDGVSLYDDELYTMAVLDAALGGSMSSRLFQEIRERRGLVYAVGSYAMNYTSGGLYTVYGGTGRENWNLVQELVAVEFEKVRKDGLGDEELARTKRYLAGNLVLALEGMSSRMMRMSRNELNHRREVPIEETLAKIDAVDGAAITALAERLLDPDLVSTTAIGPEV
ncbi:MAG TPA: pitrilysin family protein, partial [Fimbriimonadaceae bacterium]|nr:pitrilysin family protein [Fimbriimonadaceae bacterium]